MQVLRSVQPPLRKIGKFHENENVSKTWHVDINHLVCEDGCS